MKYTPIGRVRPIHRGAHDASTAYAALDVVRREDGFASYMAKRDVPAGTPLADGEYWGLLSDGGLKAVADASCPRFEETGGAAVCHPVSGYPLEVKTLIAPKQSGSGAPSPDNIRPISGWTGAKLTRCGKNLLPNNSSTQTINGVTFTVNGDGSITANGTATKDTPLYLVRSDTNPEFRNALLGNQITLSGCPSGGSGTTYDLRIYQYADAGTFLRDYGSGQTATFTNAELPFNVYILIRSGVTVSNLVFRPQIELGSTATAYEPYQGNTYTVGFGRTVYGGTLDWNTGVLTVDRGILTMDGTNNMVYSSSGAGRFVSYQLSGSIAEFDDGAAVGPLVCSHYATVSADALYRTEGRYLIAQNGEELWFSSTGYTNVDDFKAYLNAQSTAGTPVQVAYKLKTPTVIQLSPVQIAALSGTNTLVSDCGDTRAAGRSDMTWVTQGILDRLAALESAAVSE